MIKQYKLLAATLILTIAILPSIGRATSQPIAAFTPSTSTATTDQAVQFDATGSVAPNGGTIMAYAWDFGDGVTGSGVVTSHTYISAGTFTVTLGVTDDSGQTSNAQTTVIVAAPVPGAHASFFSWSVKPAQKKFSISKQGPSVNIYANAINDGNQPVWTYAQIVVQGDGGVNQVLYTGVVQLAPGQQVNGDLTNPSGDPTFHATMTPTTSGAYTITGTVYYSNMATQPPVGDSAYTANPNTVTTSWIVRP